MDAQMIILYRTTFHKEEQHGHADLLIANKELAFQNIEKEKRAAELVIANKELAFQNTEKEKRAAELIVANKELAFQNKEKEKRAAELVIANKELAFQNEEKEKRAAELVIANTELVFQNREKEKRAAELLIANKELAFQNEEKEKRAAELVIANTELVFQNKEKEKRAAELLIANKELIYQNKEKEKRAAELYIANRELTIQNKQKEKSAAELIIANKELAFQNTEKEKRATELFIAHEEMAFEHSEKEKRAAELAIANTELAFQNAEKERRSAELLIANKELESFTFISSHDLQEPLRKIQAFSNRILTEEYASLSEKGRYYFERSQLSALHMQTLINDLLAYSRTTASGRKFEKSDLNKIIREAMAALKEEMQHKGATIEMGDLCEAYIIPFQFRQLIQNLIANSLKFSRLNVPPHIVIKSEYIRYNASKPHRFPKPVDYCHISFGDNGIGFSPEFKDRIFEIFQRLHPKEQYEGTGIGLTIVKKIVDNHSGIITATGIPGKGCIFDIYIPEQELL
jgi:signal transduction histidine kinase